MLNKNLFQATWWIIIIITHATVGSCEGCKKKKRTIPSPKRFSNAMPTASILPKTGELSDNLVDSTGSLGSESSDSSGFASGSSSSGSSSGSSSSSSSSGSFSSRGASMSSSSGISSGSSAPPLPSTPFAGLPNVGNTCYMNAVLQVIAAVYKDEPKDRALKELIDKINTGSKPLSCEDINRFINSLPDELRSMAESGKQHDSYHFLTSFANSIEFLSAIMCTEKLFFKKEDKNIYSITKQPEFISLSHGTSCVLPIPILDHVSNLSEMIKLYQNTLVQKGTSLDDIDLNQASVENLPPPCVERYQEKLQPVELVSQKDYITYIVFESLPDRLCIYLPRLDANNKMITYPVAETFHITIHRDPNKQDTVEQFNLNAFIVHIGKDNSGHYVAYVKREEKWYQASDSTIKEIEESDAKKASEEAYLLFYEKQ